MRKIISERNLVIFLFVIALAVFSMAQENSRQIESRYFNSRNTTSAIPAPKVEKPVTLAAAHSTATTE